MHLSLVSTMDVIVIAIQEASSRRKRAFSTSKQYLSSLFCYFLCVIFDQLDPDPVRRIPSADPDADDKINAIRIQNTGESATYNKHSELDAVILSLSSGRWQLTGSLFDL